MAEAAGQFKHRGFLVFSGADRPAADTLQRELQAVRAPAELVGEDTPRGPVPADLAAIYLYGDDLPDAPAAALPEPALTALAESAFLVVLCSPAAVKSDSVNEAIRRFKLMGRRDHIIAVVIGGKPWDGDEECFPATLRFKQTSDGAVSTEPEEPVAALVIDARGDDAQRQRAIQQLAAALLGTGGTDLLAPPAPSAAPAAVAVPPEPKMPVAAGVPFTAADMVEPPADEKSAPPTAPEVAPGRSSGAQAGAAASADEPVKPAEPATEPTRSTAPVDRPARPAAKRRRSRFGRAVAVLLLLIAVLAGGALWARRELAANPPLLDRTLATSTDVTAQMLTLAERLGLPPAALTGLSDSSEWTWHKLAELGPDNPKRRYREAAFYLALARQDEATGNPEIANQRMEKAKALLATVKPQQLDQAEQGRDVALAQIAVGNALVARGATDEALALLRPSLAVMERRKEAAPDNPDRQRDLSLATIAVGDALLAKGMTDDAMQHYRDALTSRQQLVTRDPEDEAARRDLSLVDERIGDVRAAKGDTAGALEEYRKSLALRLAAVGPGSAGDWQPQLSVSFNKIGDMLKARKMLDEALNNYRAGLALQLAAPVSDKAAQRNLSVSYERIGDLLRMQRNWDEALAAYRQSLAIRKALAAADTANPRWARDLSVSYERIGDVLLAQGKTDDAIAAYRTSLSLRERLAADKPADKVSQRDVAVAYNKLGDALTTKGQTEEAVKAYHAGLAIREKLAAAAPDDAQLRWDLLVLQWRLASTGDEPAKRFGEIVATLRDLAAKRKLTIEQARWLPAAEKELARAQSE